MTDKETISMLIDASIIIPESISSIIGSVHEQTSKGLVPIDVLDPIIQDLEHVTEELKKL
jgi:hypothetical protein